MSEKKLFLGIDTSNYTTSLSLCDDNGNVIANVRRLLEVESGKRGLRQSDALFLHTKALPSLSEELFSDTNYSPSALCCVGVSTRPRDAEGSYMPCFLSGLSFASGISDALKIPMFEFSHQAGHIEAAVSSCEKPELFGSGKFISFHVSGGTTEALLCEYTGKTYNCEIVGGTNDASAGQMIDRAGVMLGMKFPCGKELDRISSECQATENLGKLTSMKGAYFSMSGLENKVKNFVQNGKSTPDIARFLFDSIASALEKSTLALRDIYGNLPVLYAGGVMSNSRIRSILSNLPDAYFASPELSSDNAAGVAILAFKQYQNREENK